MNEKDLDYYLGLKFNVLVEEIPEESGGGFEAYIEELGGYKCNGNIEKLSEDTCNGYGETRAKAIQDLLEFKDGLIRRWYADGYYIPKPMPSRKERAEHRKQVIAKDKVDYLKSRITFLYNMTVIGYDHLGFINTPMNELKDIKDSIAFFELTVRTVMDIKQKDENIITT